MSETLDGHGNKKEPTVELEENHPTSEDLDLGIMQPSSEQELEDISIKELKAIKTQLDQKLHITNLKQQILQTQAQLRGAPAHENQDTGTPNSSTHREKRPQTDTISTEKHPSRFKIKNPYSGKSLTELETFIGRAESWFDKYPKWYSQYPHYKVGKASDNLSSKQFLNFNMYQKEKEPEPIT
ncbi:uncharacterized protein TRUGW13939_07924 [Talaromyces rugulosus]|uniref:Uncharacterized protein n=1 Tax=Talaromyces rugulosus TaxID=121627 RepID=A0A7H8R447_TALRU|nr:uncharacterized protein TRUGW13939_07924 [Talaromyces rugulosus]QKX60778.1 hypothetical protein TRUGW13939_07924 [Talaromyces rugulosus]